MRATTRSSFKKLLRKARRASIESLSRAGGAIRLVAMRSIRKRPRKAKPSEPGTPPVTRTNRLRRAILYAVEKTKQRVVIGPSHDAVADVGRAHEFGGKFRQEQYDARPFMGPALEQTKDRLPKQWEGSVK
ncbi:MAG: hypothetical protein GC159_17385 [Phycisphaera sp.]|nr:hypothetical protein [Phycisphaera sp.]